ncbi:MAG: hypothetical protein IIY70_01950 [Oscillospiraceae bacterium]|nr:hypothetical protein [Oscillospiraceae bacterium]
MNFNQLERRQFTFYASFLTSVKGLPKCRQQETVMAILEYGLYGTEPTLSGSSTGVFEAIRPILDASRSKAASRMNRTLRQEEEGGGTVDWSSDRYV